MDPQLARLLSNLSLSASARGLSGTPASGTLTSVFGAKAPRQTSTPVPSSPADMIDSSDWSLRQPRAHDSAYENVSARRFVAIDQLSSKSTDTVRGLHSHPSRPSISPPKSAAPVLPSTSNPGSAASKRTSGADISPYMSRAAEQPVTGKRLRQLALLESVVDESSRRTPILGQQTAQPTSVVGHSSAFSQFPAPPPLPPSSVPPYSNFPTFMPDNNLSSMYQQHTLADPRPQMIYQTLPRIPVVPGTPMQDEAFVVRPRTSNTFRPIPPPSSRQFGARASMSQAQLLGILSNGPAPSAPLPGARASMFAAGSEMHGIPLPILGMPAMGTVPGSPGRFSPGRATPAASANLLNILNSRAQSVAPAPHPHYSQYAGIAPQ
jgi:mRNA-decapping enzyme subunit 2